MCATKRELEFDAVSEYVVMFLINANRERESANRERERECVCEREKE